MNKPLTIKFATPELLEKYQEFKRLTKINYGISVHRALCILLLDAFDEFFKNPDVGRFTK